MATTVGDALKAWHEAFGYKDPPPRISAQADLAGPGIYAGTTVSASWANQAILIGNGSPYWAQPIQSIDSFLATDRTAPRAKCGGGCPLGSACNDCAPVISHREAEAARARAAARDLPKPAPPPPPKC